MKDKCISSIDEEYELMIECNKNESIIKFYKGEGKRAIKLIQSIMEKHFPELIEKEICEIISKLKLLST